MQIFNENIINSKFELYGSLATSDLFLKASVIFYLTVQYETSFSWLKLNKIISVAEKC